MEVTLSAVQMVSEPGKVQENCKRAEGFVREAAAKGAQVVVIPELFNTGYFFHKSLFPLAEEIGGYTTEWMQDLARELKVYITGAIYEKDKGKYYDTTILCGPGGYVGSYRKINPGFTELVFWERGKDLPVFETDLGRMGTIICFDMTFAGLAAQYFDRIDMLLVSSAWPDLLGAPHFKAQSINLPMALAAQLRCPVVYANLTGPAHIVSATLSGRVMEQDTHFAGTSAIVDCNGMRAADIPEEKEGVLTAKADLEKARLIRKAALEPPGLDNMRRHLGI